MQMGVVFPQTEIGTDPLAIRDYTQAVQGLGYRHIMIYDHVVSPGPTHSKDVAYSQQPFHEPFVLFGYVAALTQLELVTGILILPQRQTALVAKQAAEVDVLTNGKLRLGVGVGWNQVEYEALATNFHMRGRAIEEQIEVLRLLWSQEFVTYHGAFHAITNAGLNPLPVQRPIPIWMGGESDIVLRRTARLANGWIPDGGPDEEARERLERLHRYAQEAGRDPASIGIEGRVYARDGTLDSWVKRTEEWRTLGATHMSISTMDAGYTVSEHIDALRRYSESLLL
ncbi:MAG: LLM class F420-dependent oxidoreductase [Ktedonobacteraceae bacterium]|nr:LLM class F420-dependent oxidoreductase [Ktedonobacteraceae bacterium]